MGRSVGDELGKAILLAADLRAFQAKLNAAMLKADPSVAPVINRLNTPATGPKIVPFSAPSAKSTP
jgi:hypothetical protein